MTMSDILRDFTPGHKAYLVNQYRKGDDMSKYMVSPKALELILAESQITQRE